MDIARIHLDAADFQRKFDGHDWAATPIGARDQWSPRLSGAVEIMLDTPQPMFITWGADSHFLFNSAYAPVLGTLWNEMLGGRLPELWAPIWSTVEPFFSNGFDGKGGIAENVPIKSPSSGFTETRYYTFSYTPVRARDGQVVGGMTLVTDTTEKVEAISRVVAQRNATFRLFEEAPGFVAMVEGEDHRFVFANAAYLKMVNRETVVGLTVNEALPELKDQSFEAILDGVFQTGERYTATEMPILLNGKNGSQPHQRYVTFVYEPMRDEKGAVSGIFAEGHDVTEKVFAERKVHQLQFGLIHANRLSAMGAMATTIAHELNQPLTAVLNYLSVAERMLERRGDMPDLAAAVDSALANTHRAAEIIRSVRRFTKLGEIKQERVPLNEVVREAGALVAVGVCAEAKLTYDLADDLAVAGDPIQIQQVILNLLRNACEADEKDGRRQVTISSDVVEGMARVRVDDKGPGFPPDQLEKAFDAYQSTKPDGMGVGLAISRTIIEAHGGTLWAENRIGGGARLSFTLPLAA